MSDKGADRPTVSVIVVTYNSRAHAPRCFAALAAQTMADFEAIVIDNASEDGGPDLPGDPRFRIVRNARNAGFAAANNQGARAARADWIATLNPDAFPEPNWLEELLRARGRAENVAMVGSLQLSAESSGMLDGAGDCYHAFGVAWRGLYGQSGARAPATGEAFGPCAAAALYERALFLRLGGFDEDFFCYHEDVDLAFRMRLAGARCVQSAEARVAHIGSASSGRVSDFAIYHGVRNRIWTFVKDMPLALLIALGPAHAATNLFLLARSFQSGVAKPTWRGMRDAAAGLPAAWRKRRAVQSARAVPLARFAGALTWSLRKAHTRDHDVRPLASL